jgi:general secretion pathway protein J
MSNLGDRRVMLCLPPKQNQTGFSLIEILVVMVILALTTSLLTEGLSTTWRSFERLSARDLMNSSAQLPVSWFEKSLAGALLYHPYQASVRGEPNSFEFITFASPDDIRQIPQRITWRLATDRYYEEGQPPMWYLAFQSETSKQFTQVASFVNQPQFEYWNGNSWLSEFLPSDARLPLAVRIMAGNKVWLIAKPGRPVIADIPVEMSVFGAYEF